jgi:hypothetical protein
MADVNIREIKSQSIATNAEIYTRGMLRAEAGLPCWHPEPRSPVLGDRGIVPGDVGIFDLMDGFTKIFNIWEDETFAHQLKLPPLDCTTRPSRFSEGDTVVNGISAKVCRSEDGRCAQFSFHCADKISLIFLKLYYIIPISL